jgi:hypothetical protein
MVTNLGDLRRLVQTLERWGKESPDSFEAMTRAAKAMADASPELLGMTAGEAIAALCAEEQRILAELPAETAERLRLCSAGTKALRQLIETGEAWVEIQDKHKGTDW